MPDVIAPALNVLFCGINPGLWSAAVGHHFARPGNRFWKVLHQAGFTAHQFDPSEEQSLLENGVGITNLVARSSAAASDITYGELRSGRETLERKVRRYEPRYVAVLGIGAFRVAFERPKAHLGEQPDRLGRSRLWLLPNPSGLQAHYQLPDLVQLFGKLRRELLENRSD